MKNKIEQNQKVLTENQRSLKYWEDKLSKLVLQDINDLIGAPAPKPAPAEGEEPEEGAESTESPAAEDTQPTEATSEPLEIPRYSRDELSGMSKETLKGEIAALEEKTQNVNIDLGVLAEYRRRVEEHAARSSDLATAVGQRDTAKKRCDDLRRLRLEGFMEGFSTISLRLKEMYQMITMGGNAELELVDSLDPFSEGILFSVMPPKKSWKNISNLSGGEKTLSSLALVFALHHYKPTPLYVMDEIDAALDFRNVSALLSDSPQFPSLPSH
jgi:structural maintenance of chromosome 4